MFGSILAWRRARRAALCFTCGWRIHNCAAISICATNPDRARHGPPRSDFRAYPFVRGFANSPWTGYLWPHVGVSGAEPERGEGPACAGLPPPTPRARPPIASSEAKTASMGVRRKIGELPKTIPASRRLPNCRLNMPKTSRTPARASNDEAANLRRPRKKTPTRAGGCAGAF